VHGLALFHKLVHKLTLTHRHTDTQEGNEKIRCRYRRKQHERQGRQTSGYQQAQWKSNSMRAKMPAQALATPPPTPTPTPVASDPAAVSSAPEHILRLKLECVLAGCGSIHLRGAQFV